MTNARRTAALGEGFRGTVERQRLRRSRALRRGLSASAGRTEGGELE